MKTSSIKVSPCTCDRLAVVSLSVRRILLIYAQVKAVFANCVVLIFVVSCLCRSSCEALASPLYDIVTLGLTNNMHTRDDGYQLSNGYQLNEAGQVNGNSNRYNGSVFTGRSAWLYDGSTTVEIGFYDREHTREDGYVWNDVSQLNEAGQVSGSSNRYNGSGADMGLTAWLFDGSATVEIGHYDSEHTRADGYQRSESNEINEAGQVSGFSDRYIGSSYRGFSTWLYDGSATVEIGLYDSEHTNNNGSQFSYVKQLNEAGQVSGYSNRYSSNGSNRGRTAWLYDGSATVEVGFYDSEHTRDDGYQESRQNSMPLNEAGQVIGRSSRYNGSSPLGATAWFYDGSDTVEIGFYDSEHTRDNGYQYSTGALNTTLNESGQVTGISYRYNGGGSQLGKSAWLYNGSSTVKIGLYDSEHTRDDGFQESEGFRLNEAGQVRGSSSRYSGGSAYLGSTTWLYDGSATVKIGLNDGEHTRDDGYQLSSGGLLNEAGQVTGGSSRYNGGSSDLGRTAWFYDGSETVEIGLYDSVHTRES